VPRARGAIVRLLGISPTLSMALQRPVERRARRHQARELGAPER
jgi:hypothetical protein